MNISCLHISNALQLECSSNRETFFYFVRKLRCATIILTSRKKTTTTQKKEYFIKSRSFFLLYLISSQYLFLIQTTSRTFVSICNLLFTLIFKLLNRSRNICKYSKMNNESLISIKNISTKLINLK
jgi:hypothetical protein